MFLGHYGIGMAAKKIAPKTSLGLLLTVGPMAGYPLAAFPALGHGGSPDHAQLDQVLPVGIQRLSPQPQPVDGGLLGPALVAGLYRLESELENFGGPGGFGRQPLGFGPSGPPAGSPPTPLGKTVMGLGLWNYPIWTLTLEFIFFIVGFGLYMGCTEAKDKIGSVGPWALAVLLVSLYVATMVSPPPPNTTYIAWGGIVLWGSPPGPLVRPAPEGPLTRPPIAVRKAAPSDEAALALVTGPLIPPSPTRRNGRTLPPG